MFSDREEKIINAIGRKKLTFGEIAQAVFKDEDMPLDYGIKMNNCVKRIKRKCRFHNLDWSLDEEKRDNKLVVSKRRVR